MAPKWHNNGGENIASETHPSAPKSPKMVPRGAKIAPRGTKIAPRWPEDAHTMIVFLNRYRKTCNKSDRTGPFFSVFFWGGAVFLNRYRMTRSWAILGQFYAMSGLRKEREGGTWRGKADVRSSSQNVHAARARARFSSIQVTTLKPSW